MWEVGDNIGEKVVLLWGEMICGRSISVVVVVEVWRSDGD